MHDVHAMYSPESREADMVRFGYFFLLLAAFLGHVKFHDGISRDQSENVQ